MTFNREATERQITFSDIASKTSQPVEQVSDSFELWFLL